MTQIIILSDSYLSTLRLYFETLKVGSRIGHCKELDQYKLFHFKMCLFVFLFLIGLELTELPLLEPFFTEVVLCNLSNNVIQVIISIENLPNGAWQIS